MFAAICYSVLVYHANNILIHFSHCEHNINILDLNEIDMANVFAAHLAADMEQHQHSF